MPAGMGLPESVVFTFTYDLETVLGNFANQILWQGLVVRNLQEVLGRLVLFQFLAKCLQRRRCGREVEVCFVPRESEQKSGLYISYRRR